MTNNRKKYSDAWDEYSIKSGETWIAGRHKLLCKDVLQIGVKELLEFTGGGVSMTYCDPPWNQGALSSFCSKADVQYIEFHELLEHLIELTKAVSPIINYMEMGKQYIDILQELIKSMGGTVYETIPIFYNKTQPAFLLYFGFDTDHPVSTIGLDHLEGQDDLVTPMMAINREILYCHMLPGRYDGITSVLDLCTGLGATGRAVDVLEKAFYGIELNKRRLANLLQWFQNGKLSLIEL